MDTISSLGTMDGPAWWPAGARIATDKVPGRDPGTSCTYVLPDDRALDSDEVLCTPLIVN